MITIAIPTYERTTYIRGALESCLHQSYSDYEIIINDSSSHDWIRDLDSSYGPEKIRYIRNSKDVPIIPKLTQVLAEGRGEWMLVLCDDDWLDPEYLATITEKIRQWPHATLFRCRYRLIDKEGNLIRLDKNSQEVMPSAEFLRRVFLPEKHFFKMNISGIVFPRKLLLELGGFPDLQIPWHTDRLTWAMLAAEGGCIFEEKPLCSIRLHPGSISSSFGADLTSSLESDMLAKHIFEGILNKVNQRILLDEDRESLTQARRNLQTYMLRHLSRSLDHGFITYLSKRSLWSVSQLQSLLKKMKELEISPFPSLPLYCALNVLPFRLRNPLLQMLKSYKVKKWCA